MTLNPTPDIPPEIVNAAQGGDLVVFVGAGISRLIDCPSWGEFADRVLQQLTPKGIDYHELSQIQGILDPKKRLSIAQIIEKKKMTKIDYRSILYVTRKEPDVYSYLNSFNSSFVTTNYEKFLSPISRSTQSEEMWRYYRRDQLLGAYLDNNGVVMHLHGCIDAPESMIITTRQYLDHYSSMEVQEFLRYLFKRKTVLFLGYGLDEIEVLEYILRRGGADQQKSELTTRYMLQGCFNAEMSLFELLRDYYLESFGTQLIGFPKDHKSHAQQTDILALWAQRLKSQFGALELADEAIEIRAEIRD